MQHPASSSRPIDGSGRRRLPWLAAGAMAATTIVVPAVVADAVPNAAGIVIDDFEDGDAGDWGFFGGNNAGGGGGALADRPYEGGFYLSTGWGGEGTASDFYGGAFKNFDDSAQVTPPSDPWFNVWVLNQSDTTADGYRLEVTVREDTNGDGWTDGADDSFRLDTSFGSADFDDEWQLVSAPLSAFSDLSTGGDGTFDGDLDEIVIVFAGVTGSNPSVIEADFDQFAFSSGGPLAFDEVVFDDVEHGDPLGNGWFTFNGSVGGGGIAPNDTDLPPSGGGAYSLETGWGSGGTPGFYGGFGRTNPSDISGTDHFNFWIAPDAGQEYTLEINLQEDDNGDGAITPADDDEFQYDCVVSATGPCAIAGGGWQLVSIPLDDFFDDNSFLTGGNGVLDPTTTQRGGNGGLDSVVVAVIGGGSDVNARTDSWTFSRGPLSVDDAPTVIDDFETAAAPGTPCAPSAPPLGFCTFSGAGSSVVISTSATPPAPVGTPGDVLQMDVDATSFAGFIHGFESGGAWVSQDWSTSEGFSLWFHGSNSGTDLFVDILDNRNPGSTTDDAERWSVGFVDDFTGWQLLEFPFSTFARKEIGNGAPNDGFGLFEVHGWALGTLGTGGPQTFFVDDVAIYGVAAPPDVTVQFGRQNTLVEEGTTGDVVVSLNRALGPDDPAQVSIDYATERSNATPGEEFTPTSGTLTFVNGGPTEQSFQVETFDDTKFEGDEQIVIRLTNPVDVERGPLFQGSVLIDDNDDFDPKLLDDFEQGAFFWDGDGLIEFDADRVAVGDPDERPGQDASENLLSATVPGAGPGFATPTGEVIEDLGAALSGASWLERLLIKSAIHRLEQSLDPVYADDEFFLDAQRGRRVFALHGQAAILLEVAAGFGGHASAEVGDAIDAIVAIDASLAATAITVAEQNGGDASLVARARKQVERAEQLAAKGRSWSAVYRYGRAWRDATRAIDELIADGATPFVGALVRDFPLGQDWTGTQTLDFWFRGTGSGDDVTITLKDNRAPDPGPDGWELAWADEFDGPAGAPPNPENWVYELGDTTPDGKNGWGNEELQYYTDSTDNSATDGNGNLVITLDEADGTQECYYGPCEFESARLLTQNRAEFAYGRVESRLRVPDGGDGLWPAFWSLGTDITANPWPAAGEIDFMEYVSRLPNEIFGTIHGPGYNGGGSFGGIYDFGRPVYDEYHTFTVEWEPELITWYVDGIQYHQATPADVAPNPWVFEKPFFLLLNFAIGGNFGGPVDPGIVYPQEYLVDYVRVYQGPDTAERFETSFTDDSADWRLVSIPVTDFTRSADQPAGAPDDGLGLDDVWGYGFELAGSGTYLIDHVERVPVPPPTELVVTSLADSGDGSLRDALAQIAAGGTITIDTALAGGTITLDSELVVDRSVTVDASAAPGLVLSGGDAVRVLNVAAGATVRINDLVVADGAAGPFGGGILNAGTLQLDRVVVRDNVVTTPGPANFEFGGGGIYNTTGAALTLTDSTVSDNESVAHPGGGVFGFFGSDITIERSTISGNVSGDVAGGLRSLGNATVLNSTISGNTSTAWHGGAAFLTDGNVTISNSTIVGNFAPDGTAGGLMVATFGAPVDVTIADNVIADNGSFNCQVEGGATAVLTSAGGNVVTDGSCAPDATDQVVADAGVAALADNGGPTLTHALVAGSPAIDAGVGACPATDQRGVARPQGGACDVGSFESTG